MTHRRNYKKKKERSNKRKQYETQLRTIIRKHGNDIWIPNHHNTTRSVNIPTHSWYNSNKRSKRGRKNRSIHVPNITKYPKHVIRCKKVILYPNQKQHRLFLMWMDGHIKMYNETLKFIKTHRFNKTKPSYSWKNLRTNYLKHIRDDIIAKIGIKAHMLDGAIKSACTAYKSAFSNLRNGNITHFRIRYTKRSKPSKILYIESQYFDKNKSTFCAGTMGEIIKSYNNFDLSDIKNIYKTECTLHYNAGANRFTLLIPLKENMTPTKNKKIVSIDPGIRTFLTGISENHVVEIGNNLYERTAKELKKIDNINNSKVGRCKKSKYVKKKFEKIKNRIIDMHWKSIKYLTKNYSTILIGKWSTKRIVCNETSILSPMLKRVTSMLSFYKYLQRLKYKCNKYRLNLILVHEGYTSVLCSRCGNKHLSLNGNKRYCCEKCGLKIDRDVNGARNIMVKGMRANE